MASAIAEKDRKLFERQFMSHLCDLQTDKIVNVRFCLAEWLAQNYTEFSACEPVQKAAGRLKWDSSRDISLMLKNIEVDSADQVSQDAASRLSAELLQIYALALNDTA